MSSLAQITHDDLPIIVATETLSKHVDRAEESGSTDEISESYSDKKTAVVLEEGHPSECISEQNMSTTTDRGILFLIYTQ